MGVSGWNGPYRPSFYNTVHNWGGAIGYTPFPSSGLDFDGDGIKDYLIDLDDDVPGEGWELNHGQIPVSALRIIDGIIDDGNLSTGQARGRDETDLCGAGMGALTGNGSNTQWEICPATGELYIKLLSL